MSSAESSANIKKSVLMRYPDGFFDEVSRALIGYKSHRDNKKVYKAIEILHNLIEFVTIEEMSGKRVWELTKEEINQEWMIEIPKELVEAFQRYYLGPRSNGALSLKDASPGPNMDPSKDFVVIRKPMKLKEAWGDRPNEYIALVAGFSYKIQIPTPSGFPTTETIPMIDWNDPEVDTYYTNTIPFAVFTEIFDNAWYRGDQGDQPLSLICTRIEKVIAKRLASFGFYGDGEDNQEQQEAGESIEAGGDEGSGDGFEL